MGEYLVFSIILFVFVIQETSYFFLPPVVFVCSEQLTDMTGSSSPGTEGPGGGTTGRPNILFVMADDHTSQAFQSYGSRLANLAPTDNINRLAQEGARLSNCFCTNSVCTPSRASILTGQYSHENDVYTLGGDLDPDRETVAHHLNEAGYRTGVIGKWHLGTEPAGFDYYSVLPGQGRYVDPLLKESGEEWKHRHEGGTEYEGFSTDVITDLSIEWMKDQRESGQPFCMMTHFKASHEPFSYPERHADLFTDTTLPEPPSLWEDLSHRSPGSREYGFTIDTMARRLPQESHGGWEPDVPLDEMSERERKRHGYQQFVARYLRSVATLDENVGRLLDYLDEAGLAEDTIVVYTSDQGYFLGEHDYIDKRWMFEESIRMPFLIRYPREIDPGTVLDDIVLNIDFAPTFLDVAGIEPPEYMQGRSFRPNLGGETPDDWREAMYYRYWNHGGRSRRPAHYGIRTQRYKLVFYYGLGLDKDPGEPTEPGIELYDLERDPHEMDNVYDDPAYEEVATRLKDELLAKKRQLGDTDEEYPELVARREEVW
jgi:arylsulfatase A-like enzyme